MLLQHMTVDCVAIVFACAEVGVTIHAVTHQQEYIESKVPLVDLILIGPAYVSWINTTETHYKNKPLFVLDEKNLNQRCHEQNCRYTPTVIDLNHNLIVGPTSGSTGLHKSIAHTNHTFILAAKNAHHLFNQGDVFASFSGINHIGFLAVTMIAPLFVGVTVISINYLYEMMALSARGILTRVAFYESMLIWSEKYPDFQLPANCFKNCTVITAGGPTSEKFVDTIFFLGAEKFVNFYGCNETLSPFFVLTLNNVQDKFSDGRVGELVPEAVFKIVNDQLYIKVPSLSPYVTVDHDGYYNTGDYAREENSKVYYLGRELFLNQHSKIFSKDVYDVIQSCCQENPLYFADYKFDYNQVDQLDIYVMTDHGFKILTKNIDKISSQLKNLFSNLDLKVELYQVSESLRKISGKITLNLMKTHVVTQDSKHV